MPESDWADSTTLCGPRLQRTKEPVKNNFRNLKVAIRLLGMIAKKISEVIFDISLNIRGATHETGKRFSIHFMGS
jgi:hypothetical protein